MFVPIRVFLAILLKIYLGMKNKKSLIGGAEKSLAQDRREVSQEGNRDATGVGHQVVSDYVFGHTDTGFVVFRWLALDGRFVYVQP